MLMRVLRGLEQIKVKVPCAVTIGTFDGVHKGHLKIISRLKEVADERGLCTTLVTFYPHPRLIVRGGINPVKLLTSQEEKLRLLEKTGLDQVLIIPFDETFSNLDYRSFVSNILLNQLDMKAIVMGYDHSFGKNREGNFENLSLLSAENGFYLEKVGPFQLSGQNIGSSRIREQIMLGAVDVAADSLGRLYALCGTVIHGAARGRLLHFPTANLKLDYEKKLIPENCVYAVDVIHESIKYKGMLNIGFKPTFETGHAFTIEVHIHNFDKDIYGQKLTIFFKKRLRSEKKFESKEALIAQLEIDKNQSLKL
jgi:riboflavin kinase/FMN adenylyltransferase